MTHHPYGHQLVYAADITFQQGASIQEMMDAAERHLDRCCEAFYALNMTIKGNTIFRLLGAQAFTQLAEADISIFADYKLFDVQSTCTNDASWLQNIPNLNILTVAENVHQKVFKTLNKILPDVIVAPIYPLTDLADKHFIDRGEGDRKFAVEHFFKRVAALPTKGVICSPKDLKMAPHGFADTHTIITPGIRPEYTFVSEDTNAVNALTPTKAIRAGADILVVGSPIRYKDTWRENAMRILEEIEKAQ